MHLLQSNQQPLNHNIYHQISKHNFNHQLSSIIIQSIVLLISINLIAYQQIYQTIETNIILTLATLQLTDHQIPINFKNSIIFLTISITHHLITLIFQQLIPLFHLLSLYLVYKHFKYSTIFYHKLEQEQNLSILCQIVLAGIYYNFKSIVIQQPLIYLFLISLVIQIILIIIGFLVVLNIFQYLQIDNNSSQLQTDYSNGLQFRSNWVCGLLVSFQYLILKLSTIILICSAISGNPNLVLVARLIILVNNLVFLIVVLLFRKHYFCYLNSFYSNRLYLEQHDQIQQQTPQLAIQVINNKLTFFRRISHTFFEIVDSPRPIDQYYNRVQDCIVCFNNQFQLVNTGCLHGGICQQCLVLTMAHNNCCLICRRSSQQFALITYRDGYYYSNKAVLFTIL